ncbi:hypothetical protein AVEN_53483-1 [Araneus ventricosus]|uniref:Uncharacterized protein n=1 Tax=Araneus ventricosus TaxID=182803 RepID=A0A4Y2AAG5_ARAVE|nr:hypothetical protein AVEN_53483-1 [Araneus ventricosus]
MHTSGSSAGCSGDSSASFAWREGEWDQRVDLLFEEDRPFVEAEIRWESPAIDGAKDATFPCYTPSPLPLSAHRGHQTNGKRIFRFRPRFAFFPVVGTGRIDVARGLVSASVVSRVVAVYSSHNSKGPDGTIESIHSSAAEIFAKPRAAGTARLFEFHRPQYTIANLERLEVRPSHARWNKALGIKIQNLTDVLDLFRPFNTQS